MKLIYILYKNCLVEHGGIELKLIEVFELRYTSKEKNRIIGIKESKREFKL